MNINHTKTKKQKMISTIEKECKTCFHKAHKGECEEIVEFTKRLQKETGKKRDVCGCYMW